MSIEWPRLRSTWLVVSCMAILTLAAVLLNGARAQSVFERMVVPGPLTKGHAEVEKNCEKCHAALDKAAQSGLCLVCHKEVASDRQQRRGFHGLRTDARTGECKSCHTDHKGRDFNIAPLDRETFNHAFTNFQLKGAHTSAPCSGCHKPAVKMRAAPSRCIDCHKPSDPHKGRLGEQCDGCHNEEAWRTTKPFDHAKTRFPLIGAHVKATCAACHVGEHYKGIATTCVACHGMQDTHKGRYGTKCETCHSPSTWTTVQFDHAKTTKFPLRFAHTKVKCDGCHTGDLYRDKLSTSCVSCHRSNDPHKGQLGDKCAQCHNERGWRQRVQFDHDLTRFPLVGRHATVTCEECHRTPSFKDAPRACSACHVDRHHAGRFGTACALCHSPAGWARWRFDHDRQTQFALTGAHKGLDCHACHREKAGTKASGPRTCFNCHANDDVHQGSFGRTCEPCHSTASFKHAGIRR